MSLAALSRRQAAEKLDVKPRRLAAWLLPPDSKERRTIDPAIQERVIALMAEQKSIARKKHEGALRQGVTADRPYICEKSGVVFPAIFRDYEPICTYEGGAFIPTGKFHLAYTLHKAFKEGHHCEQISALDPAVDEGWLSITHLRSHAEMEGFIAARVLNHPDDTYLCEYNGAFFVICHHLEPKANAGLIVYVSRFQSDNPYFGRIEQFTINGLDPEGRPVDENAIRTINDPSDEEVAEPL